MKAWLTIAVLATVATAAVATTTITKAASPSFDCAKAQRLDEVALCQNDDLAWLDNLLDTGFRFLKKNVSRRTALKLARTFIVERQACGSDADCIRAASLKAIAAYQAAGAPIPFPKAEPAARTEPASKVRPDHATASPAGGGITVELADQSRRLCHFSMAQTQRYDGNPHDMNECLQDPLGYSQRTSDANQIIAEEWKAASKPSASLPDSRPLISRMVLLYSEVSDFRLEPNIGSPELLVSNADTFDLWSTTLKEFKSVATTDTEMLYLSEVRQLVETRFRVLYPELRRAFASELKKRLWENDIEVGGSGDTTEILTLSGFMFSANKNKAETQRAIEPLLIRLRFKEARYKAYREADDYTYYKLASPADGQIVLLAKGSQFEAIF